MAMYEVNIKSDGMCQLHLYQTLQVAQNLSELGCVLYRRNSQNSLLQGRIELKTVPLKSPLPTINSLLEMDQDESY